MSLRRMGAWMPGGQGVVHPDTHELCVIEAGSVGVHLDGRDGRMRAGQISFIPAGVVHGSWTEEDALEEIVVHVDAASLDGRLGPLHAGIRELAEHEASAVRTLRHAAMHARPDLADEAALIVAAPFVGDVRPAATDPRLVRVMEAVAAQLTTAWTVASLARVAAMSPAQFSRAFKTATGRPPLQWVIDQRVDRAAWLMRSTRQPLSDIAQAVGFRTPSRLTEAFTRRRGEPPSAWRARQGS